MKQIIICLAIALTSSLAWSQTSIGTYAEISEPSTVGVSFEYKNETKKDGRTTTGLLNVGYSTMTLSDGPLSVDGKGYTLQLGGRTYYSGTKGWYGENFITYSSVKFDETILGTKVDGKYSYWSIINPAVGYRFDLGKYIMIDPYIGFNWKWEVKGTGIVDNKAVDNLIYKAGIKIAFKL
ncbi:MAG: hypothetical protein RLZZ500_1318 [Bacteroidota bacterium]|jgi:hypothetical protein